MKSKQNTVKKVIKVTLIVVALAIIAIIVLGIMGYPLLISEVDGNLRFFTPSPFWAINDEFDYAIVSTLKPLRPSPPPHFANPDSPAAHRWDAYWEDYYKEMVRYFLDNDLTDDLNYLDELLKKAVESNPQRTEARRELAKMESVVETIKQGIELSQKYRRVRNINITKEDREILHDVSRLTDRQTSRHR
jgi:hypothetical protein